MGVWGVGGGHTAQASRDQIINGRVIHSQAPFLPSCFGSMHHGASACVAILSLMSLMISVDVKHHRVYLLMTSVFFFTANLLFKQEISVIPSVSLPVRTTSSSSAFTAWFCIRWSVRPVVWMMAEVFRRSSLLPRSCSCSVASWGPCCLLASLKRRQNCGTCPGD